MLTPLSVEHALFVDNWGTNPSTTPGTSVTPGTSNGEGTFTQLLTALANDATGFHLRVSDGSASGSAKNHLLDIGVDPAGGSAYTAVINNIVCGGTPSTSASTAAGSGAHFFFPLRIPAGATVAARIQGSTAAAGTVRVAIRTYQLPSKAWSLPIGQYSETIGTITNSDGVSFTPGNATDGTWTSLGTTAKDLWWWQLAYQVDNSTVTAEYCHVDLGAGASGSQLLLQRLTHAGTTLESFGDMMHAKLSWFDGYHPVPAGTEMWIRGRCNNNPDSGYNGVAIGIGG